MLFLQYQRFATLSPDHPLRRGDRRRDDVRDDVRRRSSLNKLCVSTCRLSVATDIWQRIFPDFPMIPTIYTRLSTARPVILKRITILFPHQ